MKNQRLTFDSAAFRNKFHYSGSDLGACYTRAATTFRVWAPLADEVSVVFYRDGLGGRAAGLYPMKAAGQGTWRVRVPGEWHGVYFTYRVRHGDRTAETVDAYAQAVGVNGQRAMVVDLKRTDPTGWRRDRAPTFTQPTDAVIYELHVRDATIHASSGARQRGRFLGLTERGTRVAPGVSHRVWIIFVSWASPIFTFCLRSIMPAWTRPGRTNPSTTGAMIRRTIMCRRDPTVRMRAMARCVSANSSRWCRRCTGRDSGWSWMWSTTIPTAAPTRTFT
jgi:hypothetical protein